jgi:alpha-tubulin suppressor-like RCC1 family protein
MALRLIRCRNAAVAALVALVVSGCGGGGSAESSDQAETPGAAPDQAAAVRDVGPVTPMVAAGDGTSFLLTRSGVVYSWGNQVNGRLGDGEIGDRSRTQPSLVLGLSGIRQIATGAAHGLALRADGAVMAWGANGAGQLGNGQEGGEVGTPFRVGGLGPIAAIAAGGRSSFALDANGRVLSWGENVAGQLGLGDADGRTVPTPIPGLEDIAVIGAGGQHAFAFRRDGVTFAWGNNRDGQLGLGGNDPNVLTPRRVAGLAGLRVTAVDGGRFHTIALIEDGSVRTFGASNTGQAGSDSAVDHFGTYRVPITPFGVTRASGVSAGDEHTLVLTLDSMALALGHAGEGRLGDGRDGRSQSSSLPGPADVADVVAVAAGSRHSLVIVKDGTVGCFGSNFLGQCGQSQGFSEIVNPIAVQGVNAMR